MKKKKPIRDSTKLQLLVAPDMFEDEKIQLFSAKDGNWLGTISKGETLPTEFFEDTKEEKQFINPNQTKLF